MSQDRLAPGKLPAPLLARVLERIGASGAAESVRQGPGVGRDVAAIRTSGERLLLVTADPITFAGEDLARYAVTVNANDIAVAGGAPRWMVATVLLAPGSAPGEAETLLAALGEHARRQGIALVGGHTEVTPAVERTVVAVTLLGDVEPERFVPSDGARPGDAVLCAGRLPTEGLALLATEHGDLLRSRGVAAPVVKRAAALLDEPGLAVAAAAEAARDAAAVHAMHDPTEGGIATALHELADAAGVGLVVETEALPWHPEARPICAALGIDPLGLIASGSLLVAALSDDVPAIGEAWEARGIPWARVARVAPASHGGRAGGSATRVVRADGAPLPRYDRDEITRALPATTPGRTPDSDA